MSTASKKLFFNNYSPEAVYQLSVEKQIRIVVCRDLTEKCPTYFRAFEIAYAMPRDACPTRILLQSALASSSHVRKVTANYMDMS
jgi:hypothetical protein